MLVREAFGLQLISSNPGIDLTYPEQQNSALGEIQLCCIIVYSN